MSRAYEAVIIPEIKAVPEHVLTKHTSTKCDLCSAVSKHVTDSFEGENDWSERYDVEDVTVSRKHGVNYPDCGSTTTVWFDICPKCFQERLVPWFAEHGVEPQTHEIDW